MKKIYKRVLASFMTLCCACMFSALALTPILGTGPDYTNIVDIYSIVSEQ